MDDSNDSIEAIPRDVALRCIDGFRVYVSGDEVPLVHCVTNEGVDT